MTDSMFDLSGRTAVVTGAFGLLGKEHCIALAEHGANVVAVDLVVEGDPELVRKLERNEAQHAVAARCDITVPASVVALHNDVVARFGGVDILVNNAAIDDKFDDAKDRLESSRFERYSLAAFRHTLEVNVVGTFLMCQAFGSRMAARRRGSIVNVASTYGIVAPDQALYRSRDGEQLFFKGPAYPASKGAVIALTKYLASYWGNSGVRVNALSPGGVENGQNRDFVERYSERTMLGRMASPSDYRGALVFLASDASAYMTGTNVVVDGGWTAR